MWRLDQKTGVQTSITPRRPAGAPPLRFNWTPPIALSPHNPAIVYTGAQVVFRSLDRGDHWQEISPDLTTNEDAKQHGEGFISYCTLTTLAESPVAPGVIWTGSDDGKVQVTRDGGATWLDRTAEARRGRRAGEFLGQPRLPLAPRRGHGVRDQDRLAPRRLPGLDPTRRPISARPGRRSPGTCRPASPSTSSSRTGRTRPPLRRDRVGRLRDDRRREDVAAVQGQHALGQGHRPGHPSARERPGRRRPTAGAST